MPCSACGLSKRHLFDQAALDGGYDVVATGHNLDDEAAVLFGNVLRWQTDYLGRQLPGAARPGHGFPRKVKPLVRLGEREMAAYCVVRGIDYIVEECPMAAGNQHLGYKEALNAVEATLARAPSTPSTSGSSPGPPTHFRPEAEAEQADAAAVHRRAGRRPPARCAPSAGWSSGPAVTADADGPGPVELPPHAPAPSVRVHERAALEAGERVLLIDSKQRRYLVTLADGGEFHSHAGLRAPRRPHRPARGHRRARRPAAPRYRVLRPTLADFVLKMPRGAQVIYPKDLGPILMLADIFPGARVLESGVGSGALSMTMLRAGADVTGYELREDFANRARANVAAFLGAEAPRRATDVEVRDCYDGIDETDLDRIVLDLPEPWRVVQARRDGAAPRRDPGGLHAEHHPGRPAPRGARRAATSPWPRRSRCCTAPGTSRARRCGPTTAWWPTPASSPTPACSGADGAAVEPP